MEDFFDFFSKSRDRWLQPDESDVENRQGHDDRERGGLPGQIMMHGEALAGGSGIFAGAFSGLWKQFDGCHCFVSKPA